MVDPLDTLLADGVIDEVVSRLKSGKEADVWLVRHAGEIVTAKVYRARDTRSFKNNAAYTEGRRVRNTRTQRAMDRGTRFGQAAAEEAWKSKEADALYKLHAAGLRVPKPVMFYEGVLLMEVVVDAHGHPAPRLVDAHFAADQAAALYADLRKQVVGMLCCDLVHGDLSPFNVLVGWNGPVVIDFPQVVGAAHNQQAEGFLLRDLRNIHRFCAALDPSLRAAEGDAAEIWRAYVRRELTPDFVPTGRHLPRPAGGGRAEANRGGPARTPGQGGQRPRAGAAPRGGAERPGQGAHPQPHGGHGHSHGGGHAQGGHAQGGHAQGGHAQGGHAQGGHGSGQGQAQGVPGRGGSQRGQPQGGSHPRAAPATGQRGAQGRGPQGRPAPEVIRVVRPPRGAPPSGSGGGSKPASPPSGSGAPARPQHGGQPHGGGHGGQHPGGHRGRHRGR